MLINKENFISSAYESRISMFEKDSKKLNPYKRLIVKELDAMQKNYDELIYYDPKKFHEAEMKELAIEQNNLAIAKELIKNGASKELILKSIDITEEDYNKLVSEIQKETKSK